MNITGAIFDFDGTLFDSMPIWKGIKHKFFDKIGLKLTNEDEEAFKGLYLRESLILAKERFNMKESYEELLSQFFDYIKERYLTEAEPKNDIIEFLEKLKAKGVKMGIATATGEPALEAVLEKIGTDKETTWVFEDALYAAKTAKANGYNLVGIFDGSEENADELKQLADIYILNYNEIDL